jgi:outer membrane lipoprotein-sorting protein
MTDEEASLVRRIRERTRRVTSFVADYRASYNVHLSSLEVTGKLYFLGPDRYRSVTSTDDRKIITIRKGTVVQRYLPARNEIWRYDLADVPQTEPINFATADLRDPFSAIEEADLTHEGTFELESGTTYVFSANVKNSARQGMLDTRKGFSIRYQPKDLDTRVRLHVDYETGLLRRMIGTAKTGKEAFRADYSNLEVNVFLDESLFAIEESTADYRVIDITETLLSSMNPDAAETSPSRN